MNFFKYVPALYAIYTHVEQAIQTAKADDNKVDSSEAYSIALGSLVAITRILFPQLTDEQQDAIESALFNLGKTRDVIADGYAKASTALTKADAAYTEIEQAVL